MNLKLQSCRVMAAVLLAFFLGAAPAQAQMIDYASLEALFDEPVTTSATGKPQRASDIPVAMEIITAEAIRRSGAVDIPSVLRNSSGLSVWQWTHATADVSIRGYNQAFSPRLLVLINGRQVYSDMYGNMVWENIPIQLEEIRQIEIVKGPNSALFGFNAAGGVINILTYNPIYDDVSSIGGNIGSRNYRDGHMVHTEKIGERVGVRISAGGHANDEFTAPPGSGPFDDGHGLALSLDSVVQLTSDSQLRIEVSKTKAETVEYSPLYTPFDTHYDTHSARALYTINTSLGLIQANVYRNWQRLYALGAFNAIAENEVTVAQIEDLFQIGTDHIFRLQGEYRHNALTGTLQSPGSEIAYDVYAMSGMWHWKMRDNLTWSNALRLDHLRLGRKGPLIANPVITSNDAFDKNLTEFSYNSGLVWNVSPEDTVRLAASRGIQAPSLLNFGIDFSAGGPIIALGNPDMNTSIVNNYEIIYDRKVSPLNGVFRSSLFYQETKDIQALSGLVTGAVTQPDNIGTTHIFGIEAGLQGRVGQSWNWDASYTFQGAHDDLTVNSGVITVPYNGADATPEHMIKAHVGYAKNRWETDFFAQYVSHYKVLSNAGATYNEVKAGGNVSMSGRIGYNVTDNFTVALSGQEINHSETRETSGPKRERQVFLSLKAQF